MPQHPGKERASDSPAPRSPRTTLPLHACAPPPSAEGLPSHGGGEGPARCASGGRAKNNCSVLATALPLADWARRRLRIGELLQPVKGRGCVRGGGAGAAGSCSRQGGRGLSRLRPAPRGVRGLRLGRAGQQSRYAGAAAGARPPQPSGSWAAGRHLCPQRQNLCCLLKALT